MNRAQRRHKHKNRDGSKKGMTKVVYLDGSNQPVAKFVQAGGKIHQQALKNSKAFRRGARGE